LGLKLGRSGPFLACNAYPDCTYSCALAADAADAAGPRVVGADPETGGDVVVRKGPYGWYVQHQNKRTSLPVGFSPENLTLQEAVWLLSLPKNLGVHPGTGHDLVVGVGRFGPYIKHDGRYHNLKHPHMDCMTLEEAAAVVDRAPAPKARAGKVGGAKAGVAGRTKSGSEGADLIDSAKTPRARAAKPKVAGGLKPEAPKKRGVARTKPVTAKADAARRSTGRGGGESPTA